MRIVDYYPNVERVITTIESMMITDKEYQKIKKISKSIKEIVEKEINDEINPYRFVIHHIEKSVRQSDLYTLSPAGKEIIIANILLPDDIKIAELLNKNGFTIENLKSIIRFRSLLKNVILNNAPINKELEDHFIEYKENVKKILELFNEEFNTNDQTIILNRICELLTTHPNYFEKKITESIKKDRHK